MRFRGIQGHRAVSHCSHDGLIAAIETILRETIHNPVGPEFIAPPAREADERVTVSLD